MTAPLVVLGIPAGDRVHSEFMECVWAVSRATPGRQGLVVGRSSIVANARNQIVDGARSCGASHIMFLDSDMKFPSDTVAKLLAHDLDIVGATYVRRGPPFDNLGKALAGARASADTGLVEMELIPTGCLLVRMSVFDALRRPYFRFEADESAGILRGEDYTFSNSARAAGYRLWCDVDISKELGHMYQYALRATDDFTRSVADQFAKASADAA